MGCIGGRCVCVCDWHIVLAVLGLDFVDADFEVCFLTLALFFLSLQRKRSRSVKSFLW